MSGEGSPPRDLTRLFDPRSVVIVGASAAPGKWGNSLARNALRGSHRRSVFLVNRGGGEILGQKAYRSLDDVPQPVDLVVLAIGTAGFEPAVDDALRAGAGVIVAITAGLAESSEAGLAIERRVTRRVREAGAVIVGPNSLGIADTTTELDLAWEAFPPGAVGLISQSGNLALELGLIAAKAHVGFSRFVSIGNQADLEAAELMRAFTTHAPTRVIAVYGEEFRDGRDLAQAALEAHEAGKPVILLSVGSSRAGARAARSHTGALVSSSVAIDAACAASGMLRVSTPNEMIEAAQALLAPHQPRGRMLGIVGDGGGHVAVAADIATTYGLELPVFSDTLAANIADTLPPQAATFNPVDFAGGGEHDLTNYSRAVEEIALSGEVDAVLLTGYFGGYGQESADLLRSETEVAVAMATAAEESERPLFVQTMYLASAPMKAMRDRNVPVFGDIDAAVRALARVAIYAESVPSGVPVLASRELRVDAREGYFEARELLAAAGIAFVEARSVDSTSSAHAAARELGFPVVLKAVDLSHKSDSGGVALGLVGPAELDAAWHDMAARLGAHNYSVERMASEAEAVELLVGVKRDHSFGPVLVVGIGGVFTEVMNDVAVALAPVSPEQAGTMISSLRAAALLIGGRGRPVLDVEAAARAAATLSMLAARRPDLTEIEINPLLVQREGVLALDARVVTNGT